MTPGSRKFKRLREHFHRLLFFVLLLNCDDESRLEGDPDSVAALIPWAKASLKQISQALSDLKRVGLILWYKVGRQRYIEIIGFTETQSWHSVAKDLSSIPPPPARQPETQSPVASPVATDNQEPKAAPSLPRQGSTQERKEALEGESEGEKRAGNFSNLSSRYLRILGKYASKSQENQRRFAEACSKWGEDAVLAAFESWAEQKDWVRTKKNGLHYFWQDLPDAMAAAEPQEPKEEAGDEKRDRLGQKPLTPAERAIYERHRKPQPQPSDKVH